MNRRRFLLGGAAVIGAVATGVRGVVRKSLRGATRHYATLDERMTWGERVLDVRSDALNRVAEQRYAMISHGMDLPRGLLTGEAIDTPEERVWLRAFVEHLRTRQQAIAA